MANIELREEFLECCRPTIAITDTGSMSTYQKMCYIVEKLEEVVTLVNGFDIDFTDIQEDIAQLQLDVKALEDQIPEIYDYVDTTIDEKILESSTELQANIDALYDYVQGQFVIERQITDNDITLAVNELAVLTAKAVADLQEQIDNISSFMSPIYNPTNGESDTIEKTISDVYQIHRTHALTCSEFDALGLTADEFDASGITADEFAVNSETLANNHLFINPYNGVKTTLQNIIGWLAMASAPNPITCAGFDALGLTADEFDAKLISAYDFDFNANALLP